MDYVYIFYEMLKQEFKKAGRTDCKECMNELLKGDDSRFVREFGVKLPNVDEYKRVYESDLPIHMKGEIQQSFFGEWVGIMEDELNWRLKDD